MPKVSAVPRASRPIFRLQPVAHLRRIGRGRCRGPWTRSGITFQASGSPPTIEQAETTEGCSGSMRRATRRVQHAQEVDRRRSSRRRPRCGLGAVGAGAFEHHLPAVGGGELRARHNGDGVGGPSPGMLCRPNTQSTGNRSKNPSSIIRRGPAAPPSSAGWQDRNGRCRPAAAHRPWLGRRPAA